MNNGQRELSALARSKESLALEGDQGPSFDRRAIADRYTLRGLATTPEQIMVTLGAQHAIFLIARTLLRRGDRSLVELPSHPRARQSQPRGRS